MVGCALSVLGMQRAGPVGVAAHRPQRRESQKPLCSAPAAQPAPQPRLRPGSGEEILGSVAPMKITLFDNIRVMSD